jgi:hypothetical protein
MVANSSNDPRKDDTTEVIARHFTNTSDIDEVFCH